MHDLVEFTLFHTRVARQHALQAVGVVQTVRLERTRSHSMIHARIHEFNIHLFIELQSSEIIS